MTKPALEQNDLARLGLDSEERLIFGAARSFSGGRGHEAGQARVLELDCAALRGDL